MASSASNSLSKRAWTLLLLASIALFLLSWSALHHFGLQKHQIKDTKVYVKYGRKVLNGHLPYRDFRLEYPPGALPTFVVPALIDERRPAYDRWFERTMALCGCLMLAGVALCLRRLRASRRQTALALALAAVSPLLVGSVILSRFDLWPAALAVLGLAALLWDRRTTSALFFGAAIAAKLWPAVLIPFAFVWLVRRTGVRTATVYAAGVVAVVLAVFLPFVALAPDGVKYSLDRQLARPLQVESLGSSVLIAAHHLFGTNLGTTFGWGSQNVGGTAVGLTTNATAVMQVIGLLAVLAVFIRAAPTRSNLVVAMAASVGMLLAFGKVFSPQFVVWLVPFVVLVRGRRGLAAAALLVVALALTHAEFPRHYEDLARYFYLRPSVEVLGRDLAVLALALLLTLSLRVRRA